MRTLKLTRTDITPFQTLGKMFVMDCCKVILILETLELPYLDNEPFISSIPTGEYKVVKRSSTKFGDHFHILDVEGREFILIHSGNFKKDTNGCILVGNGLYDIDGDGNKDVTDSKTALKSLNRLLPNETTIIIE